MGIMTSLVYKGSVDKFIKSKVEIIILCSLTGKHFLFVIPSLRYLVSCES